MAVAGIIAEFNPLHNGHKYIIDCAKSDGNSVVAVISGNFVQRGDVAIVPKFARAEMALSAGVDAVLELPVPWSMSTAQNFALGGLSQLSALNIDTLYFGSECGDTKLLEKAANIILSDEFNQKIKDNLASGDTFAKIRQRVLEDYLGDDARILQNPNDTLAIEYICAAYKLGLNISFNAVKRRGAGHNELNVSDGFVSSTQIRNSIIDGKTENLSSYMPNKSLEILLSSPIADINRLDNAIISRIKQLIIEELSDLPDISEGLDRLIYNKARDNYSYSDLCEAVKSKRYTMARIRRIILSAYLGIDNSFFLKDPPYVRILGFNSSGIKLIPAEPSKPIVTKTAEISKLDSASQKLFDLENKINEQYALSLNNPEQYINEFKQKILKY